MVTGNKYRETEGIDRPSSNLGRDPHEYVKNFQLTGSHGTGAIWFTAGRTDCETLAWDRLAKNGSEDLDSPPSQTNIWTDSLKIY